MKNIITVKHLEKRFGDFKAIDDLSFSLESGKIYGIIGPNGAGKSTTMSLLLGLIYPTSGYGTIKGEPLGSPKAKALIGYAPEFPDFYQHLSCIEYLIYMGQLSNLSYDEALSRSMSLLDEFGLLEHRYKKVVKFSTGMKKKVAIIQALLSNPEILLLDEPTANLDPTSRHEIITKIKQLVKEKQITVLISSHVLSELETIIDHVLMILHGHVLVDQPLDQVATQFKQTSIMVTCRQSKELERYLKLNHYQYLNNNDVFNVTVSDKKSFKKGLIKFIYENDLELITLQEEKITLDVLYQRFMEDQNESIG